MAPCKLYAIYGSSVVLSIILFVYKISAQVISRFSLKLGVVIGPINRKNSLTFGGDPDSESFFSLLSPLRNRGFWRFISLCEAVYTRLLLG